MKNIKLQFLLILFIAITSVSANNKPQAFKYKFDAKAFDKKRIERIDSAFQSLVDKGKIPHAVTFVAHKGNVIQHKAYGWRNIDDKQKCETTDIFRMASQTKAIAVVALLTLVEEGKIQLDEPVKKYIPAFANPQVLVSFNEADSSYETRPAKRDITIKHLLTHTAGISYGNNWTRKIFDKNKVAPSPLLTLENTTLKEQVLRLAACPIEHDPGDKFTYGMGIDVIGYLAEVVSGQSIDAFIKSRVLDPLGMNDTHFYVPTNKQNRVVTLYQKQPNLPLEKNPNPIYQYLPYNTKGTFFSTGAGLSGPITDYARFCQMILNGCSFNGKQILSRTMIEMMSANAVGDLRGEIGHGLAFDDFRPQYRHRSMASTGSLRWGGMYGTDYLIDPQEELIILFYINLQPNNSGTDYKVLLHNLVYQALK